ncbi:hypothetical protein EV356DRAFT_506830 [Viridothelium virens]|uniref:Uncharacterized protein n=1 Tax=Viridothelium virens TaxID=1048519 RepID=A0A6A6H0P0_VIRVR|nr:hypothetical protein EV356DRAFT_506830 [Viridothelium virens]
MESSAPKAEIVYRRAVQERFLGALKTTMIPLWGRFSGTFLALVHESNFTNMQDG